MTHPPTPKLLFITRVQEPPKSELLRFEAGLCPAPKRQAQCVLIVPSASAVVEAMVCLHPSGAAEVVQWKNVSGVCCPHHGMSRLPQVGHGKIPPAVHAYDAPITLPCRRWTSGNLLHGSLQQPLNANLYRNTATCKADMCIYDRVAKNHSCGLT